MASPAFLLSLFVSIQVLPQISPEPGHAPHMLVSTKHTLTHTNTHTTQWLTLLTHPSRRLPITITTGLEAFKEDEQVLK